MKLKKKRPPLERSIERAVRKALEERGWLTIKMALGRTAGWPDLLCISSTGVMVFIEVKRPTGVVSKLQKKRLKALWHRGVTAGVVRSVSEAFIVINEY